MNENDFDCLWALLAVCAAFALQANRIPDLLLRSLRRGTADA
jgi:hypothetical protein